MVAQVRPAPLALEWDASAASGATRCRCRAASSGSPCSPGCRGDPGGRRAAGRSTPRSVARGQRLEERCGDVVPRGDVELHVHASLARCDLGGHRVDGRLVVGLAGRPGCRRARHGARAAVQGWPRLDVRRAGASARWPAGQSVVRWATRSFTSALLLVGACPSRRAAQQQEDHDAEERDHEDQQQPRHAGGGSPVLLGTSTQRDHLDCHVEQEQGGRDPCRHGRHPAPRRGPDRHSVWGDPADGRRVSAGRAPASGDGPRPRH